MLLLLRLYLQNARKFDPDRFKAPRNEDKARPFAYTAFGGGMHGCLGEQFGFLQVRRTLRSTLALLNFSSRSAQVKTIVSLLLRRFEIEPLDPLPEPNYKVMVVSRLGWEGLW